MLTHEELLNKKASLEDRKASKEQDLKVKSGLRDSFLKQLSSIAQEEKSAIHKVKREALDEEIRKNTFQFENKIHKLNKARDEILSNRDRRLSKITYESYSSKLDKSVDVDSYVDRCNELRDKLENRQGKRLSLALERCIPTDGGVYSSLEDIVEDFDKVDALSDRLTVDGDIISKMESFIFKYDTSKLDGNKPYVFLGVVAIISSLLILSGPLLVLVLIAIIGYNLYKSYSFYNSIKIVKNILPNISKIKESIDSGIKAKMNEDKLRIEKKFKSKLQEVDLKIEVLEDRIADVTELIKSDFSFDSTRVSESFRIKEKSLNDRVKVIVQEYEDIKASIPSIEKEIAEVNSQIVQLGKTIYNQYYPADPSVTEKSYYYPKDILVDVINNKPVLHKLTKGSSLYVYTDVEDALAYMRLYFSTLCIQMKATSYTCSLFDTVYVGTKFLQFNTAGNFTPFTNSEDISNKIKESRSEMLKRVGIIGNSTLDEYNKQMLSDDSVPMAYKVLVDLASTYSNVPDELKQIIKNGYDYGLIFSMFISQDAMTGDSKFIKDVLPYFDNIYAIGSQGISKKSKKFYENLIAKVR